MTPLNKVPPLATIAFYKIVVETWSRSNTFHSYLQYLLWSLMRYGVPWLEATSVVSMGQQLEQILKLDCLPRSLSIKLGNCLLELNKEWHIFAMELISYLKVDSRPNIEAALHHIIITADGHINKRQTLINIALDERLGPSLNRCIIARYSITFEEAIKSLNLRLQSEDESQLNGQLQNLREIICDPWYHWQLKAVFKRMEGHELLCVAMFGPKEALEYFLSQIQPGDRQNVLSRIAMHMAYHTFSVEHLLFFYNNLDANMWLELLRRHFLSIFRSFFNNHRYRHMCIVTFEQVKEKVNPEMFPVILKYLIELPSKEAILLKSAHLELYLADWETTLLSVWRMIPSKHRGSSGVEVFTIINTFLKHDKSSAALAIIEDEIFTEQETTDLVKSVLLNVIVNKKNNMLDKFLEWIRIKSFSVQVSDLLTFDTLRLFMTLGDNLKNVSEYNTILLMECSTFDEIKYVKNSLLTNYKFMASLIEDMKRGIIGIQELRHFIMWACSYNNVTFYNYIHLCIIPVHLMVEIYKSYMISTRKCVCSINGFDLSDKQIEYIKRYISQDTTTLFKYCLDSIRSKNFRDMREMLCVFPDHIDKINFLKNFFTSPQGAEALYSLLVVEAFEYESYSLYRFRDKLTEFMDFKFYFVLSDEITRELLRILDQCQHPSLVYLDSVTSKLELLPNESLEDFKKIYEVNLVVFKCCLRDSVVVQYLQIAANLF